MIDFFSTATKDIDLGGGNSVTIRKLSYREQTEVNAEDDTTFGFKLICRAIVDWNGPAFSGIEVGQDAFNKMSVELVRELNPHVLELCGLTTDEKNE